MRKRYSALSVTGKAWKDEFGRKNLAPVVSCGWWGQWWRQWWGTQVSCFPGPPRINKQKCECSKKHSDVMHASALNPHYADIWLSWKKKSKKLDKSGRRPQVRSQGFSPQRRGSDFSSNIISWWNKKTHSTWERVNYFSTLEKFRIFKQSCNFPFII